MAEFTQRERAEMEIGLDLQGIWTSIGSLQDKAIVWPDLMRAESPEIRKAIASLETLVAYLSEKRAA